MPQGAAQRRGQRKPAANPEKSEVKMLQKRIVALEGQIESYKNQAATATREAADEAIAAQNHQLRTKLGERDKTIAELLERTPTRGEMLKAFERNPDWLPDTAPTERAKDYIRRLVKTSDGRKAGIAMIEDAEKEFDLIRKALRVGRV